MSGPNRHSYVRAVRTARRQSGVGRRLRTLAGMIGVGALATTLLSFWPHAEAASDGTYRDEFTTASFSNSDGTLSWSGSPWQEIGESDGPSAGGVMFETLRCSTGSCLWFDDDYPSTVIGAQRTANLSGSGAATLRFDFQLEQDIASAATSFYLEASTTPSGPWTRLATYVVDTTDTGPRPAAFDLTPFISATTTVRIISNGADTDNELYLDNLEIEAVPSGATDPSLWFSIRDDTTSGPPGLPALKDGAIAAFTDPGVAYEPGITAGTLGLVVDWENLYGFNMDMDALHLVTSSLTVGGVSLLPGDVLFVINNDITLTSVGGGSIAYKKNDVGRFRPQTAGDYTAGTYAILLDDPLGADLNSMTLVEQPTRVGEVTLPAGSFLLTRMGGADHADIYRYVVTSAGEGSTSGTASKLLEGDEMGFSEQIWDIDLVEDGMGWPFPRGAIAITVEKDVLIGIDSTAASKRTIVSVIVARTSLSATARVNAILAWDGNDLGFDEDKERLDAFSFAIFDLDPAFDQDIVDRADSEGSAISFSATATDPLGQGLTYSASGLPPGISYGMSSGVVSGSIDYTAAASSPYSVSLVATDPHGNSVTDTFTWTVVDVNRPPTLGPLGDLSSAEGSTVSVAPPGSDPDGDGVSWSATGLPPGLGISPSTGVISGTLPFDASPGSPYAVTVRLTDDGVPSRFSEAAFVWTITDTNRAPVIADPGSQSHLEGTDIVLAVAGSDPDGDTLTWVAFSLPAGLTIDPTSGVISGSISYGASTGSPYPVRVRAFDDGSPVLPTEVAFSWTVTDVNRPPVISNPGDRVSTEGSPVTFAMDGTDPDADALTWSATGLPGGLSIAPGTGVISGTVSFDAAGNHAVTVRASDSGSPILFDEVAFTWSVADTNRAPVVADPGSQMASEGDAVSLAIGGSDPDLDPLLWSATNLPPGLTIDPASGLVSGSIGYDAAASSPFTVTVRATDDGGLFGERSFTWAVTETNRAPQVADPGTRSNAEGDPVAFAMSASDPDGDILVWIASGLPAGLSIDPSSGVVSGTLDYAAAAGSPHAVTIRATDDGSPSLFGEVTFSWAVANTNRPPIVADPGAQAGAEGAAVSFPVASSDPDGDAMTWSATGLPPGLAIDPGTGVISGTIGFTAASSSPFTSTVRVTDAGSPAQFGEVTFSWSVANTDRAPVVTDPGSQSAAEGEAVSLTITAFDPDGDSLAWTATGLPPGVAIDPFTGAISGTPTFDAAGDHLVTVRATDSDPEARFDEVTFSWAVADTNRPPVVSDPGTQSDGEGQAVSLTLSGSDPDGDNLVWSATGLPAGLAIDPSTGTISGSLGFAAAGSHGVTVRATDDGTPARFGEASFTWVVTNTNRAPVVLGPGTQTSAEGTAVSLTIAASDPDGNGLTFSASGLPPGLAMHAGTGVISGSLGYDLGPSYSVTITVVDDGSPVLVSQTSFDWIIGEVNRPPSIAVIADQTSEQGTATTITASASDPDGDRLTWSATGLPSGVTISPTTGVISGSAATPGAYGVTVTVVDDGVPSASDQEVFAWTVASPPGFPVIEPIDTRHDLEDEPVSFVASAHHPDGLMITWSASELPAGVDIDATTGRITGTPTTPGTWFTRVTVTDERAQAATASFVWIVESAVDLPPVANDDVITVAVDTITAGGIAIDAAGNDTDPEGGDLVVVAVSQPEIGEAELVGGVVVFRPPAHWLGSVAIRYTVEDGVGNRTEGVISVTVLDSLDNRLVTGAITVGPGPSGVDLDALGTLTPGAGTEVLLGSVFQSLYVLRVPLALLGGAVFWSLLLGGILNLGFVLRGGLPRLVRRTSRHLAIVLVPHGGRVDVRSEPGRGAVVARLTATERGIETTGRRVITPDGEEWVELRTEAGIGWLPAFHASEEVDRAGFAADLEALEVLEGFVERLRARRDFSDLVSDRGLFVAHHAPVIHFPPDRLAGIMEDTTRMVWKGRNPAYPDFSGTFDLAVATGVLDAFDHPRRELLFDRPATPATVIPVEFTNFHFVSVGADVHGPERLDQSAWIIVIAYEAARPRVIGLVREG
ncbi:MAG: putative Ig domain-containing protein [Acidimicrobiia bacterium]|nr:putative Ig domain-containing protein [Acidimicrobiia bacterium]